MGLFNKKSEMVKFEEELNVVQGSIREVEAELRDFDTSKKGIELELKLGADSSLTKRLKKVSEKVAETEKCLAELRQREGEINAEKRTAYLNELADKDLASIDKGRRATVIKYELQALMRVVDERDGRWGYSKPENLLKEYGIEIGHIPAEHLRREEFDSFWKTRKNDAEKRIQNECQEAIETLKKYLGGFDK